MWISIALIVFGRIGLLGLSFAVMSYPPLDDLKNPNHQLTSSCPLLPHPTLNLPWLWYQSFIKSRKIFVFLCYNVERRRWRRSLGWSIHLFSVLFCYFTVVFNANNALLLFPTIIVHVFLCFIVNVFTNTASQLIMSILFTLVHFR